MNSMVLQGDQVHTWTVQISPSLISSHLEEGGASWRKKARCGLQVSSPNSPPPPGTRQSPPLIPQADVPADFTENESGSGAQPRNAEMKALWFLIPEIIDTFVFYVYLFGAQAMDSASCGCLLFMRWKGMIKSQSRWHNNVYKRKKYFCF